MVLVVLVVALVDVFAGADRPSGAVEQTIDQCAFCMLFGPFSTPQKAPGQFSGAVDLSVLATPGPTGGLAWLRVGIRRRARCTFDRICFGSQCGRMLAGQVSEHRPAWFGCRNIPILAEQFQRRLIFGIHLGIHAFGQILPGAQISFDPYDLSLFLSDGAVRRLRRASGKQKGA